MCTVTKLNFDAKNPYGTPSVVGGREGKNQPLGKDTLKCVRFQIFDIYILDVPKKNALKIVRLVYPATNLLGGYDICNLKGWI